MIGWPGYMFLTPLASPNNGLFLHSKKNAGIITDPGIFIVQAKPLSRLD